MTVIETQADDSFVGLEHAETRLSAREIATLERARNAGVLIALAATQVAWIATLLYVAYVFVSS